MARPNYKITTEICEKAERLASRGLTKKEIATSLGMVYETLRRKARQHHAFSAAIERGIISGIKTVTNNLFTLCEKGDISAIKYYLNNRSDEWSEKQSLEIEDVRKHPTMQEVSDRVAELIGDGTDGHPESHTTH